MTARSTCTLSLAVLVMSLVGPAFLRADVPVVLTRVGDPIWRPVDFHLFSAHADTDEAFFAVADLLAPFPEPQIDPPYDNLVSDRMAAAGFQDATVFLPSDIDGQPRGIYFAYTLVPDPGTTGSSSNFASGPIIPNRLMPLTTHTELLRNGAIVDPAVFDGHLDPLVGFDGYSHAYAVLEDDANFFPPGTTLPGSWEFRTIERDAEGNGWDISAPFQVVPEPSSLALALILLVFAVFGGGRFVRVPT